MDSIQQLPSKYLNFIKNISSTFSHSPQRAAKLINFILEEDKDSKINAIRKYNQTRWTSLHSCLERIIDIFGPLKQYYISEKNESSKEFTQETEVMLNLFKWLVGKFCYYIKEFEKDRLPITYVVKRI